MMKSSGRRQVTERAFPDSPSTSPKYISHQNLLEVLGELTVCEQCVSMALNAALDRSSDAELRKWLRQEYETARLWVDRMEQLEADLGSQLPSGSPLAELELVKIEEDLSRKTPPMFQEIWDLENVLRSAWLVCERIGLIEDVLPYIDDPEINTAIDQMLSELGSRTRSRLKALQSALRRIRLEQLTVPQDRSLAA